MAHSEDGNAGGNPEDKPQSVAKNTKSNGQDLIAKPEEPPDPKIKVDATKGRKDGLKPGEKPEAGKISNVELKKRAKEEKAARRAKEKGDQQTVSATGLSGGKRGDTVKGTPGKDLNATGQPTTKNQHRRTSSSTVHQQKQVPLRPALAQAIAPGPAVKKESKNVALFGHLYGTPRRTTLAGTSKDIHPAVLALGLQMSSYVVCGSNARCVATLLVFKRVRVMLELLDNNLENNTDSPR